MMSSQQSWRRASSVSPGKGGNISTNMGVITCGQPSRMSERVPSKSNKTWLISGRGAKCEANSTSPPKKAVARVEGVGMAMDLVWLDIKLTAQGEGASKQVQARR